MSAINFKKLKHILGPKLLSNTCLINDKNHVLKLYFGFNGCSSKKMQLKNATYTDCVFK